MTVFGGGFGGGGGGRGWSPGGGTAGLPFAGIPPEMQAGVEKLVAGEPDPRPWTGTFSQVVTDARPFTLFRFLAPRWPALLVALVLVTVDAVLLQVGPLLTQRGIDHGVVPGDAGALLTAALLYVASIVVHSGASYLRLAYTGRFGQTLMHDLRMRVFMHIQRQSLDYFTDEKAGRIMTRMTSDIESLQQLFTDGLVNLFVQLVTLLFILAVLVRMDPTLTVALVAGVIPVMLVLTWWFTTQSDRAFLRVRDRIADVLSDLSETLSGIRILAMYNRQDRNTRRHRRIVGDHLDANLDVARIGGVYGPGSDAVGTLGQALIILIGGRMALDGRITIGELTAFVLYLQQFFAPIQQLVALHTTYQQGKAAITKLAELFATKPTVAEKPAALELPPIAGEIRLEGVTFGYDAARPVLRDVDLTIAAGETFALVGPTGAGKSTVAKLVTRFYDPQGGRVLVDGHDLRDVTFASLRRQLGVVPQEPFLFAGTLRDNIAFAAPDAPDDVVRAACEAVGILDLVDRLPAGLDTPVHERGVTLSSGERQLIALARAFLAHPRVLILDEATSNLDLATESQIERALDALLQGRTAILIAHRLNTARRADRIGVVADGRLVEVGSHDELVARGGRYAELVRIWESQHQPTT